MKNFAQFMGAFTKLLLILLVGLIGIGLFLGFILIWSNSNKQVASSECKLRRFDQGISAGDINEYHETCMKSKGYRTVFSCLLENQANAALESASFCFFPSWQDWK